MQEAKEIFMRLPTFKRGIHPPEWKSLTENCAVVDLNPRGALTFPMAQHLGAPCEPCVAPGDRVLVGQPLGTSQGVVSAVVCSSVSGTVKDVAPVMTIPGTSVMAVTVESDGQYEEYHDLTKHSDPDSLSAEEIREAIAKAGIVGMGGAGFPTHVKLTPPPEAKIDHLIVNASECEPYLTCDYRLILEQTDPIIQGIKVLLKLFPEAQLDVGIEENKMAAAKVLMDRLQGMDRARVTVLQTKYPQGGEKQLIYAITGREVPIGKLPADAGAIVCNVLTTHEIGYAVQHGRMSLKRIVTVSGDAVATPMNVRVPLGISVREILEFAGGFKADPAVVIAGGPMMGPGLTSLDVPVVKTTSGLVCLSAQRASKAQEQPCIRCSRCVKACPMGLQPLLLDRYAKTRNHDGFQAENGMSCIECGACSYTCPAGRFLAQGFKETKKSVAAAMKRKAKKAAPRQ